MHKELNEKKKKETGVDGNITRIITTKLLRTLASVKLKAPFN